MKTRARGVPNDTPAPEMSYRQGCETHGCTNAVLALRAEPRAVMKETDTELSVFPSSVPQHLARGRGGSGQRL